ncbi:MAG TPA: aspartyl protease family protein [Candidatus Nanoarchaeia archaeon]|nr:aspartyl protease family protein [Candidatus Nanoarchaeia archaeon]
MVRIPLLITPDGLILPVTIRSEKYRVPYSQVIFLVDTGSTLTFLSPDDASRLHIPVSSLMAFHHVQVGGTMIELSKMNKVELILKDAKGIIVKPIVIEELNVGKMVRKNKILGVPSILGLDFLLDNRLSFHYLPSEKIAYLETE